MAGFSRLTALLICKETGEQMEKHRIPNPTRLDWLWVEKINVGSSSLFERLYLLSLNDAVIDAVECVGDNGIIIAAICPKFDHDYKLKTFNTVRNAAAWIDAMKWRRGFYVTIEGMRGDMALACQAEGMCKKCK